MSCIVYDNVSFWVHYGPELICHSGTLSFVRLSPVLPKYIFSFGALTEVLVLLDSCMANSFIIDRSCLAALFTSIVLTLLKRKAEHKDSLTGLASALVLLTFKERDWPWVRKNNLKDFPRYSSLRNSSYQILSTLCTEVIEQQWFKSEIILVTYIYSGRPRSLYTRFATHNSMRTNDIQADRRSACLT